METMQQFVANKAKINKKKLSIFAVTLFLILLTICIVINPSKYINSCYSGLLIWATNVLPSLLPFFVITKILAELKSLDKFFNKFSGLNYKLFKAPACSGYIFGMSIISGYPVGAKLICDFYEKGLISSKDANKLATFCSTSGPLFIIGTVGSIMLKSAKIGYILYLSHILSSILNGILYRNKFTEETRETPSTSSKPIDYNSILSNSMTSSISSVMIVGGFVAIFYMIIDILLDFKILLPISQLLEWILKPLGLHNVGQSIASGIVEVTRGCKELSALSLSPLQSTIIASGLISFGGLSIHAQSLCFLTKCKINVKFYFLQKITQTIFACAISFMLGSILL